MKKFEFISETKYNKPDVPYFYTKEDGYFVSDSGSYDKDEAYEKFLILAQGGCIIPTTQVLEEKFLENKD
ncbi:MAG: hypothetical protein ACOYKI_03360 [Sediminibacterium sp.]